MVHVARFGTITGLALMLIVPLYATSCEPQDAPEESPQQEPVRFREGTQYALAPGEWINTAPLTSEDLRGRVVLVDFWDYTCVNCLRTLPYLREWYERYHPYGFEIVGVHTPEFAFAREVANVRQAVEDLEITWPVLLDNDYETWQAFDNRYWPHHFLFNAEGEKVYDHVGEGSYGHTEEQIQDALRSAGISVAFPEPLEPVRDTDQPGAVCYRVTPETYLGFGRGQTGNPGGLVRAQAADYQFPADFQRDHFYLEGSWRSERENLELSEAPGRVALRYQAASVNLVLHPPAEEPGILRLSLDGAVLPAEHAGADVQYDEAGQALLTVEEPRMYYLVASPEWGEHTLRLEFLTPGTEAFAFTFGSACLEPAE
jgi:thiol-disulfide isomerase/thioredoxin